ncbi:hypothetical protein FOG51_04009 [Hanseniaspora uvarum]|nr:hypothetical protein FOG51_04009 [Hanseniaspora uvarum]KAF0275293.1 hypothetical protein FOG50_03852 [Hanseniaspora uvarum]KKA01015.1 hypothetical protein D499_0BF00130 [Hanseniaspora uvarum DSM 2768]KKA02627.1 hypothetical protein D499_0G00120 [Hanseniaspora uvarum DSM 2768]
MQNYQVSELEIKNQIKQLIDVTVDPSTIPITQQKELITKFDDLIEKYPLTLELWQRYLNLYIYNLKHDPSNASAKNHEATGEFGDGIDENLNAKFNKAIQLLKPNNFPIYEILLDYQLKSNNYVTGGKQALQSIIEQFVKIWDKALSLDPLYQDHYGYIMKFVDLFQHWQVINNDDLIIRNNTIRKHIIHFVSNTFYKDLEKVWKWFVNWDANNAGSGEYKINQVSPTYMKMRSKYIQFDLFYNGLKTQQQSGNITLLDVTDGWIKWENDHKDDYESLKIYQSRVKFIIQHYFHLAQFQDEYAWDLLIHNTSNSGEFNQLFLYEKSLVYLPRSLNLTIRYCQALEMKNGKQETTVEAVESVFKKLIENTKKSHSNPESLEDISGNFDQPLNLQLSMIFKKMLQENTRIRGLKGLRLIFRYFRDFIKAEKCLLNSDIFIDNCIYELNADGTNMSICVKILSMGLKIYGKDDLISLNKYMTKTLKFAISSRFSREHIKSYFESYKQVLQAVIKEKYLQVNITDGTNTINNFNQELIDSVLNTFKPWIEYESSVNMGKYPNVDAIYSELYKIIPNITTKDIWNLFASQNNSLLLLENRKVIVGNSPSENIVVPEAIVQEQIQPVYEQVELPPELFEVLFNLPKASTFDPLFNEEQLKTLASDLFSIMRDTNVESFTYKP